MIFQTDSKADINDLIPFLCVGLLGRERCFPKYQGGSAAIFALHLKVHLEPTNYFCP
jgi:hypothetical protein